MSDEQYAFPTRAIRAGQEFDPTTGAVVPPIYMTSTFVQDGIGGLAVMRSMTYATGQMHFGVRNDWPLLASALMNSMDIRTGFFNLLYLRI